MATQSVTDVTTPTTLDELQAYSKTNSNKLMVLDFKASWCGPCKAIKPFLEYLKENYPNVEFHEVDIEDEDRESIVNNFDIQKVPTFVYYKNGSECSRMQGTNKEKIEELINDNL